MPETMIKNCWGKRSRGEKDRVIWKHRHHGDWWTASLWIAQLHQVLRRMKSLCTFFSLLLSPVLQQGELQETVSRKADFPVAFVGMAHLTDDTIRVFTLFLLLPVRDTQKQNAHSLRCPVSKPAGTKQLILSPAILFVQVQS